MTIKSTLSVAALVTAMAFSGAAFAQDAASMIGDQEINDTNRAEVQAYCDALALEDQNSDTAGENPNDESNLDSDQSRADGTTDSDDTVETSVPTSGIDTTLITLDDCRTSGLVM